MKGLFITFEGIEGCGKTTQIKLLYEHLKKLGRDVILTREPGGTAIGDKIRAILLDARHDGMTPIAELLLYAAARNQHIAQVIEPAVKQGKVVLCDRYADATEAYQGAARKIAGETIEDVHRIATGGPSPRRSGFGRAGGMMPDMTILLDLPAEEGLKRARGRNSADVSLQNEDRFEREDMEFHKRVRAGYLAIARRESKRVIVVDAMKDVGVIHDEILKYVLY